MDKEVKLTKDRHVVFAGMQASEKQAVDAYNKDYMAFLSASKTERLFCANAVVKAEDVGFKPLSGCSSLSAGDKVYVPIHDKALLLFVIGKQPLENGLTIVGSHIDSPRLDLKPLPLYESNGLALFKTHYYGGIKKYQWVTTPLALYGTVATKDGRTIRVAIGDAPGDPVFCISDLLIHLAGKQMGKKASEVVEGEELNLIVASVPVEDEDVKEAVKERVLEHLYETYGFKEEDFESAEFKAVPAGPARDVGLDRSMVGAYAQDDRVCSYAALEAITALEDTPELTACVILADKEEIGSYGNTGMQSRMLENALAEICALTGVGQIELILRRALKNSYCLSGDVTAAYDPTFASAFEAGNSTYLGEGLAISKYGGARGKSGSNDAHPEFLARLRACFDAAGVAWQTGELGKVDQGGGGTIAYMLASYGMDVVDCGTAVLSMHSPFEVTSKADTYMTYKGYKAFLENFKAYR